ncbi:MAG: ADOP family duplicated permease [Acidobacteriota bacterium]|nr:ADOP family duplicated permease [Acidobacteriota bacterium]
MIRHAWRGIARTPALSLVIVLSIAAGIGINTVVFSWIQSRAWKPLPGVSDGARFHGIEARNDAGMYPASSWAEYRDLRDNLRSFDAIIATRMMPAYVGDPGQVERVFGLLASGNYFSALDLRPAAGRFFTEQEAEAREPVAVISYGLWQSRFGGAPDVAGRRLRVNGLEFVVVGVTPRAFQGTTSGLDFQLYLPASTAPLMARGSRELEDRAIRGYSVLGRLGSGVSREQAQLEVDGLMAQLARTYAPTNATMRAEVLPFWQSPRGPQRLLVTALVVLQAIMLLLLLAVCGNMANLVLARASARQREVGVRLALGAGPWRVVKLLLAENLMLSLAGAALGAAVAIWGTQALQVLPLSGLPIRFQTSVDGTGLLIAMALGVFCGLLVAAAPAIQFVRLDPQAALRSGAKTATRSRVRDTLMATQVALAIAVLVAAGLFLRSFLDTRTEDTGFTREGVLLASYDMTGRNLDAPALRTFAERVITRLREMPQVEGVALSSSVPLDIHGLPMRIFTLEGRTRVEEGEDGALTNTVSDGYFNVMRIPLLAGRDFAPLSDSAAPREVIVNGEFVRRFVGDGAAVGRRLETRGGVYVIAGIAANSLYNAFGESPTPIIYFSFRDRPATLAEIHVRVRSGEEKAFAPQVRAAVRDLDPDLPVFNVRSLTDHVDTNLVFRRVPARMFSVLGPLLLILAAIGIYAVVGYTMTLRTREIGLRIALGATPRRVVAAFVGESMSVIAAGAVVGWLIAVAVTLDVLGETGLDPLVFAGVPAVLFTVAAIACWLPARRAAVLDPWAALRDR